MDMSVPGCDTGSGGPDVQRSIHRERRHVETQKVLGGSKVYTYTYILVAH